MDQQSKEDNVDCDGLGEENDPSRIAHFLGVGNFSKDDHVGGSERRGE